MNRCRFARKRIGSLALKNVQCLLVLFAVLFLLGAGGNTDNERVLCRDGFLEVVSPDPLSGDQGRQVAKMAMAAWKFDMGRMKWSRSIDIERPLKFRLLSHESMKIAHPGAYAFTPASGNVFIASTAVITNNSVGTVAHELGHVQAFRAMGGKLKVPHYFLEGHGISMGLGYGDLLGVDYPQNEIDRARVLAKLTAQEARLILTTDERYFTKDGHLVDAKNYSMEAFGFFFIEYLRIHKDKPVALMGRVFERVGRGQTYETAFEKTYGMTLEQAASEISAFFERTQSAPAERLKGTRFAALVENTRSR